MVLEASERPPEKVCNTEGCNKWATKESDRKRCDTCGGKSTGPKTEEGKEIVSGNAESHGMFADRDKYYQRRDEANQKFIDRVYDGFLSDAPFTESSNPGKALKLWQCAIDLHKRQRVNAYIDEEGLVQTSYEGHDPVSQREIVEIKENTLHLTYDRLGRETTRTLKELGVLDDPDSQQAQALSEMAVEIVREPVD